MLYILFNCIVTETRIRILLPSTDNETSISESDVNEKLPIFYSVRLNEQLLRDMSCNAYILP